jgi:hypothetical protein
MAKITGANELRAAIRKLPEDLRKEATAEVRVSSKAMRDRVMQLFDSEGMKNTTVTNKQKGWVHVAGTARKNYRWSVTGKGMTGRVGLLTPAANRAAWYLKFFLWGSKHQPARDVTATAFEHERDVYIKNQEAALDRVLERLG